jgi:uncharacterized membrane protein (DUF106 family)
MLIILLNWQFDRFEETTRTLETSLLAEKQHSTGIMSQLAETKEEIGELQKKFTDASRTNDMLQDSLKRFSSHAALITQCNHTSTTDMSIILMFQLAKYISPTSIQALIFMFLSANICYFGRTLWCSSFHSN